MSLALRRMCRAASRRAASIIGIDMAPVIPVAG